MKREEDKWVPMTVNGEIVTSEQVECLKSVGIVMGWDRDVLEGVPYNIPGKVRPYMRIGRIKFMLSEESYQEIWDKLSTLGFFKKAEKDTEK